MHQPLILRGRLGRFGFGLRLFLAFAPLLPAYSLPAPGAGSNTWLRLLLAGLLLAGCIALAALVAVRRLHDVGVSGWWALGLLLPGLNLLGYVVLLAMPGEPGHNAWGLPQQARAQLKSVPAVRRWPATSSGARADEAFQPVAGSTHTSKEYRAS